MSHLWIIKTGSTFSYAIRGYGDFARWTREGLGYSRESVKVYDVNSALALPEPADCDGVVITGAHEMVTDRLDWSARLEEWIPCLVDAAV